MDNLPGVYILETIEQVRALADELRLRIIDLVTQQPMTVKQVGTTLKVSPGKIHYHVHELERVGLLKLVETREKKGILEKYYRAVASSLNIPETLLSRLPPDETIAQTSEFLQIIVQGYMRAMTHAVRTGLIEGKDALALSMGAAEIWVTPAELKDLLGQLQEVLKPYSAPRGTEGEREVTFAHIVYEAALSDAENPALTTASSQAVERPAASRTPEQRTRARKRKEIEEV